MSFYFNCVCNEEGCKILQPILFNKKEDNFKDVCEVLEAAGWSIQNIDETQDSEVLACMCPDCCSKKNEEPE